MISGSLHLPVGNVIEPLGAVVIFVGFEIYIGSVMLPDNRIGL